MDPPPALDTDPGAIRPGDRLGRFELAAALGEGGMGTVFRAHDPELHRQVAVKVLRPEVIAGPLTGEAARLRLRREAQAMARVAHPNVIAVHEVGVDGDHVFVVMELVEGGTLRDWMGAQKRTVDEILDLFAQAGRGLAAAHRAGLVHRDFKPENVLVGADGRARVTDFGLVGATSDGADLARSTLGGPLALALTHQGAVLGTPAYMSPEQHVGEPVTAASDQFGFCVALYEALWGVRPFPGASYRELVAAVTSEPPRTPPSAPPVAPEVRAAVLRGLARDPGARFPSMEALLDAIAAARRPRRSPLVPALAIGGVAALAAIAWWAWPRAHSDAAPAVVARDASPAQVAPVVLTGMGGCAEHPMFDGPDTIVFDRSFGASQDLFRVPLSGGVPKRLTTGPDFHWNVRPGPAPGDLTFIHKEMPVSTSIAAQMSGGVARDLATPEHWDVGPGVVPVPGGIAYAGIGDTEVRILADGADRTLVTLPPGRVIRELSTSPDLRWLAIDTNSTGGVCLVDLTAASPAATCRSIAGAHGNTWFDASGAHFYHAAADGLWRFDRASDHGVRLMSLYVPGELTVSPDQRNLVYSDCAERGRLLDTRGGGHVELLAGRITAAAVGPRDQIVFVERTAQRAGLVVRDPDGSTHQLTDPAWGPVDDPAFDPVGQQVAFRSPGDGLYVVDVAPHEPRRLTGEAADVTPRFLDADRVIFTRHAADQSPYVWIVPLSGGEPRRAIDQPRWLWDVDRATGFALVSDVDYLHFFWWDPRTGTEHPFAAMDEVAGKNQGWFVDAAIALDGSAVYVSDNNLQIWRLPLHGGAASVAFSASADDYDDLGRPLPLSNGLAAIAYFWAGELYRVDLPPPPNE